MTIAWVVVFIVSLSLALYGFVGYPLLLLALQFVRRPLHLASKGQAPTERPQIQVIVAAYNEQDSIALTLKSLLKQDYPKGRYSISVFSDGSSDRT
ncbi:MAG: glycosyltransferase, partial [Parcubacteria group bacterium]